MLSASYDKTASSHEGTVNGPKAVLKTLLLKSSFMIGIQGRSY